MISDRLLFRPRGYNGGYNGHCRDPGPQTTILRPSTLLCFSSLARKQGEHKVSPAAMRLLRFDGHGLIRTAVLIHEGNARSKISSNNGVTKGARRYLG